MSARRLSLHDLRRLALRELNGDRDEWITPTQLFDRLGISNGKDWYTVALVLERLTVDGLVEIQRPGARVRRFRRRRAA